MLDLAYTFVCVISFQHEPDICTCSNRVDLPTPGVAADEDHKSRDSRGYQPGQQLQITEENACLHKMLFDPCLKYAPAVIE